MERNIPIVGKVVPNNPYDLMKQLRESEKMENSKLKQQKVVNRQKKQELQREYIEKRLMEAEDYCFTDEGLRRLRACEDRIRMEAEDVLSTQSEAAFREAKKLDFRAKIRDEIAQREKQEELERQLRKEAAEKRRKEVVEIIRKKKEDEERAIREAEEERQRGIEQLLQKERDEIAKHTANANQMLIEDEISHVAELDFREEFERKEWLRKEALKMSRWEEEQRMKDIEEEKLRKERLLEMEAKKRKLAELKEKNGIKDSNSVIQKEDLERARQESLRLSKQMRIQNKAKFVSKKRKEGDSLTTTLGGAGATGPIGDQEAVVVNCDSDLGLTPTPLRKASDAIPQPQLGPPVKLSTEFMKSMEEVVEVEALRATMSILLEKKRVLRLENMTTQPNADESSRAGEGKECSEAKREEEAMLLIYQLREIKEKELFITAKIDSLLAIKEANADAVGLGAVTGSGTPMKGTASFRNAMTPVTKMSIGSKADVLSTPLSNVSRGSSMLRRGSSTSKLGRKPSVMRDLEVESRDPDTQLYMEAEKIIRDINQMVAATGVVGLRRMADVNRSDKQRKTSGDAGNELSSIIRKAEMLKLKSIDVISKLPAVELDVIGYRDSITAAQQKLSQFLINQTLPPGVSSAATVLKESIGLQSIDEPSPDLGATHHRTVADDNILSEFATEKEVLEPVMLGSLSASSIKHSRVTRKEVLQTTELDGLTADSKKAGPVKQQVVNTEESYTAAPDIVVKRNTAVRAYQYEEETEDHQSEEDDGAMGAEGEGGEVSTAHEFRYEDIEGWTECLQTSMATAAHHAAFYGYLEVLEMLSHYFDVFALDKNGRTPLFYAALRNNLDCVLFLVGLDSQWIEVGDSRGDTCIHAAAISNNSEALGFLVSCEANPNIANIEGLTPAHLAKNTAALMTLHEAGACLYCIDTHSRMALWYACKEGRVTSVKTLCAIIPKEYISFPDCDGNTALHIAAGSGHTLVVEILCQCITSRSDFYLVNKKGYTAAHVANNCDVLKKLYEYGVDLWVADAKQRYPLFMSCFFGKADCVSFLIELGVSRDYSLICQKDFQGDTALHVACLCGHVQCASLLLCVLPGEPNHKGLYPHELAAKAGHLQLSNYVYHVDSLKAQDVSPYDIFQCTFSQLSSVTLYYGSRWTKLYDDSNNCLYYFDRVLGTSQWDRPQSYDENLRDEETTDRVRNILVDFYFQYDPSNLTQINEILHLYQAKYAELFIQLANKYDVQDLSVFLGWI